MRRLLPGIGNLFGGLHPLTGGLTLASLVLGIAALVAAVVVYLIVPQLRASVLSLLALGFLLLLVFFILGFRGIKAAILGRRGRYGTNTSVMIVAFLAIGVLVNILGVQNHQRFDLTAASQFTLSPQTLRVLKDLKQPVKAVGFFVPDDPTKNRTEQLLAEYKYRSDQFSYDFVDPEAKPAVARQYEVRDYGVVVFESQGRLQPVRFASESDFTSAILKVTGKQQKKIYFLTGHGEANLFSSDEAGYSLARQGLDWDNYQVAELSLATEAKMPEDIATLVVAGPKKPLTEKEIELLTNYLKQGGKALFLLDPGTPKEVAEILADWGVVLGSGTIIDQASFVPPDLATPAALRPQYYSSRITENLDTTFFPAATAVKSTLKEPSPTLVVLPLAVTSANSWLTTEPSRTSFDPAKDIKGPHNLAATVTATAPLSQKGQEEERKASSKTTRLVIVGDSDFASNKYFYSLGNSDLFLNSINWLSEEEELIAIHPKPPEYRRMVVTMRGWNWILYSSMGLLPLVIILAGVFVWWRRR